MIRKLLILFTGILISGIQLNAQTEFTASAPSVLRVGESFHYVVEGSEQGEVNLQAMEQFQLVGGPHSSYSSHSQWINGKMTQKTLVSYTYVFRALSEGTHTMPAASVKVGRKEYSTNEVEVVVHAAGAAAAQGNVGRSGQGSVQDGSAPGPSSDEAVFLRVIPSKREVYLGEQFVSGLKVFTRVPTRQGPGGSDLPYEGFYKKSLEADARAQQETINGQVYVSQVIQRHILIPQKTGDVEIAPYESEWLVQQRVQRQRSNNPLDNFFDDPFFNPYQDVPVTLYTRPLTISVKPLPDGAPVGFTGAVGDFRMKAELSSEEIEVNEALSLKITISGTGNLPLLGEPEVNLPPDHDLYDVTRSVQTSTAGNRISGSISFEYPIVARHAGRFRIAPVQFAWFDPASDTYRTALTEEFNFTVVKGENEDSTSGVYVPGVAGESVRDLGTDIRDITREPQAFTMVNSSVYGSRWYRIFFPLALLLTLILILLIRIVARRNADLTLVRNRQAGKSARRRLKKADRYLRSGDSDRFYEEIGKAIWGYLSHKLDIETSGLSTDIIKEKLGQRGVQQDLLDELIRIIESSEFSRFAPSSEKSDMTELYKDAAELIRKLESNLK